MLFSPVSSTRIRATPVGSVGERQQAADIDALGLERRARLGPERVVADRADEERRRAEPRGRDRLVAALAAVMSREPAADDRLAGRRAAARS